MKRKIIADERNGVRSWTGEPILCGTFDGDTCALRLENNCVIYADERPNYHTQDGREFAEVLELEEEADGLGGLVIGYAEVFR